MEVEKNGVHGKLVKSKQLAQSNYRGFSNHVDDFFRRCSFSSAKLDNNDGLSVVLTLAVVHCSVVLRDESFHRKLLKNSLSYFLEDA